MDFLSSGVSRFVDSGVGKAVDLPSVFKQNVYVKFDYDKDYSLGNGDEHTMVDSSGVESLRKPLSCAFLSQMQFLSCYWEGFERHPNPVILYIPMIVTNLGINTPKLNGLKDPNYVNIDHIFLLSEAFPMFKFHIYTQQEVNNKFVEYFAKDYEINEQNIIDDSRKIVIHRKTFDENDAELWSFGNTSTPTLSSIKRTKNISVFMISEFSTDPKDNTNENTNKDDINEINWAYMMYQKDLTLKLTPTKALLKFFLPIPTDKSLSVSENRSYFEGIIFKKAWDSRYSRDLNIVPYDGLREKDWNINVYYKMISYHNNETRGRTKFLNVINNSKTSIINTNQLYLENDFDSSLAVSIISYYLKKFNYPDDEIYIFNTIHSFLHSFNELKSNNKNTKKIKK